MIFRDRAEAGQKLAEALKSYRGKPRTIVLCLPRGGVVVAKEVARELKLPLDVWIAKKIGDPGNPEFAVGAVAQGVQVLDSIETNRIPKSYLEEEIAKVNEEIERRLKVYRRSRAPLNLENQTVILVDDGIATGITVEAALKSVKKAGCERIILAVPVAPREAILRLKSFADQVVILETPENFSAVGQFYSEFPQVSDEEVIKLLGSETKED